jgi:hypothetical protein
MAIPKTKRGGGPRTPAGKAAAAGNAIKTGAYSNITVLPGERAEDYQAIEEQLHGDFQPADLVEASMVRELASLIWKKLRLEKLEHAAYLQLLSRPLTAAEIICDYRGPQPSGNCREYLTNASEYDATDLQNIAAEVNQVRAALEKDPASITETVLRSKFAWLGGRLNNCILKSNETIAGEGKIDANGKPFHLWQVKVSTFRSSNFLDWLLDDAAEDISGLNWVLSNQKSIEVARHAAKETRLHAMLFADKSPRAFDDLNRALYKTLSELRKHQEWRAHRPIDVTPTPAESDISTGQEL